MITKEPVAQFDDPKVQVVYEILCNAKPPDGEHYEGFAARKIIDALTPPAEKREPLTTAAVAFQCRKHRWIHATSFEDAYFTGFRDAETAHGIGVKK